MLFTLNASKDYGLVADIRSRLHGDLVYKAKRFGPDSMGIDYDYSKELEELYNAIQRYDLFMKTYHAEKEVGQQ